jgi:hypothetical protein
MAWIPFDVELLQSPQRAMNMTQDDIDSGFGWDMLGFTTNSLSILGMAKSALWRTGDSRFGFAADIQQLHTERRAAAKDGSLEGRLRWRTWSRVLADPNRGR